MRVLHINVARMREMLEIDERSYTGLCWRTADRLVAAGWPHGPATRFAMCQAGSAAGGRPKVRVDGVLYQCSRIVLAIKLGRDLECGEEADHYDGDPSNNRPDNLRPATRIQQEGNKRKYRCNKSGAKGVHVRANADGSKTFIASLQIDGRTSYLGSFKTLQEAADAYDDAATERFGEFARTNKMEGQCASPDQNRQ